MSVGSPLRPALAPPGPPDQCLSLNLDCCAGEGPVRPPLPSPRSFESHHTYRGGAAGDTPPPPEGIWTFPHPLPLRPAARPPPAMPTPLPRRAPPPSPGCGRRRRPPGVSPVRRGGFGRPRPEGPGRAGGGGSRDRPGRGGGESSAKPHTWEERAGCQRLEIKLRFIVSAAAWFSSAPFSWAAGFPLLQRPQGSNKWKVF